MKCCSTNWIDVRLISPEPVIHIVGDPTIPGDEVEAETYRIAQFQAWDMLCGSMAPELGGQAGVSGHHRCKFLRS